MNERIDAGLEAYVPPDKRPGRRFYKPQERVKRVLTEKQREALASKRAKLRTEIDFKAPQIGNEWCPAAVQRLSRRDAPEELPRFGYR
jgi:hypothetical protein